MPYLLAILGVVALIVAAFIFGVGFTGWPVVLGVFIILAIDDWRHRRSE